MNVNFYARSTVLLAGFIMGMAINSASMAQTVLRVDIAAADGGRGGAVFHWGLTPGDTREPGGACAWSRMRFENCVFRENYADFGGACWRRSPSNQLAMNVAPGDLSASFWGSDWKIAQVNRHDTVRDWS